MNNLKDSKFDPRRNETVVIYGPIPPKIPKKKDSILFKIAKFVLGKKKDIQ